MVAQNNSLLNVLAREGGAKYIVHHQYFLVIDPANRGVPLHYVDPP